MRTTGPRRREWAPTWPCAMAPTLRVHRRGAGDPSYRIDGRGTHWRATRTPVGPATLALTQRNDGTVEAEAWGEGAEWALDGVPRLLGADDDASGFEPHHEVVAQLWRRHPHVRFGATGRVWESLLPSIIEQKVTGKEAFGGYRQLVRRHGSPAPGPAGDAGLMLPPDAHTVRRIPSWEWLRLHIDPQRARTAVTAARVADSLDRTVDVAPDEADRRLRSLPGVGVWTSAEVRQRALGHADAVSFFDYHVAANIGWALTGTPVDDDALAVLLEPYRPHRARVQRLIEVAGLRRPRRGPRMSLPTHYPA